MPRSRRSKPHTRARKVRRRKVAPRRSALIDLESETTGHLIHAVLKRDMHQAQRHMLDIIGEMLDRRR